ncbi:MAG: MBL fold metallo-hydrolase [Leptolyngbyaceae bacterium]|nr:MBL fold metallo-hydrolase [Leptolyngbyaceae bacterium]
MNTLPGPMSNEHSIQEGNPAFIVRFWGVRGHIPTASSMTSHYGGNTPCVELFVAGKHLIFDGGTGLRPLGEHLYKHHGDTPIEAYLFFTQTQTDRIQGFPFFRPAFHDSNRFHIYGPQSTNGASIKHALADQMLQPKSLVPFHKMKADLIFKTIAPGSCLTLDDVTIETVTLNSVNSALGYRITWNGCTVVYATDSYGATSSQGLQRLAQNADLLIFDAVQSSESCFDASCHKNLRNLSTWKESVATTLQADIKCGIMFYHNPTHEDAFLNQVESEMQSLFPNVQMAREGHVVTVG